MPRVVLEIRSQSLWQTETMQRADQTLPRLSREQLADPCSTVVINGFPVQLWQVAHLYGVSHDMPSQATRSGVTSTEFRRLRLRRGEDRVGPDCTEEQQPSLDSPTFPVSSPTDRTQRTPCAQRNDGNAGPMHELLSMVDGLIDEDWCVEEEAGEIKDLTEAAPPADHSDVTPLHLDPSLPPPRYPPPDRPLPLRPLLRSSRDAPPVETCHTPAATHSPRQKRLLPPASPSGYTENLQLIPAGASLAACQPALRAPRTAPRARQGSEHIQPATRYAEGRAVSASALAGSTSNTSYPRHRPPERTLTEPRPKMTLEDLPTFLRHPPSFLQHPYEEAELAPSAGTPSGPGSPGMPRPVTPALEDEAGQTSRWSPDSSPELSRMRKVRGALSFARLRPRKSKAVLSQPENESGERRTSASSSAS